MSAWTTPDMTRPRTVYFAREQGGHGLVKIGCTISLERRIRSLRSPRGERLDLAACFEGNKVLEARLHAAFLSSHFVGEWFLPAPELVEAIGAVRAGTFDCAKLPAPMRLPTSIARKPWTDEQRRALRARRARAA